MVELQIVILAVAGSSPVGHPFHFRFQILDFGMLRSMRAVARAVLKKSGVLNPAVIEPRKRNSPADNFWSRLVTDEELRDCDNLQKLVIGCEIIAALDAVDLLAA